jgi:hypothetical protein
MGISPKMWGKEGWHFIHYVALNYPATPTEEDKKIYRQFLDSIEHILPCPICGFHFKQNMDKHPPKLDSRLEFFNWTVDMHNFVNVANGKKKLNYHDALEELTKDPAYLKKAVMLSAGLTIFVLLTTKIFVKFSNK